jgi:hypothetical protein
MKMGTAVRTSPRRTEGELHALAAFDVAKVHEVMGRAAGELGMDIEKMRPKLKKLGLTYYDTIEQVPE